MRSQELIALALLLAAGCEADGEREASLEAGADAAEADGAEGGTESGAALDAELELERDAALDSARDVVSDVAQPVMQDAACTGSTASCLDASVADAGSDASAPLDAGAAQDAPSEVNQADACCAAVEACTEGVTRCAGADTRERCTQGVFVSERCAGGCQPSALGPVCRAELALVRASGSLRYERRPPRADLHDFDAPELTPGRGLLVAAYRGDVLLDAVVSADGASDAGNFELWLPAQSEPADRLVIMAASTDATGRLLAAVADPGHGASSRVHSTEEAAPDARVWSFALALPEFHSGQVVTVPASAGSAALLVFDSLRRVVRDAAAILRPAAPEPVLAWLGLGTLWDCGSCMASDPVQHFGQRFPHQLWIDGSSDEAYWSDALVAHELGHYVLAAYSYPPSEAGPHYVGVPTQPGLAYSEGFATFYSSLVRDNPLYFDKQAGLFFWFRIDTRSYGPDARVWQQPEASRGLFQLMDENEVAALLWGVHEQVSSHALLQVLGSARLREPPFERGYTERRWSDATRPEDYLDTRLSHVTLADYFDALRCSQAIGAAALNQVTEPSLHFPYPSESPRCR
jgi:hypothetical protein